MYIYIYIYIYIYTYMHVYIYVCVYLYIYLSIYIHTHTHKYTHTHIYITNTYLRLVNIYTRRPTTRYARFNTNTTYAYGTATEDPPTANRVTWPLRDIRLLRGCCARINHPFIPRTHLHCPPWCNTISRFMGSIRPLLRHPVCIPYTIHYW